jgi:hypothetical protein
VRCRGNSRAVRGSSAIRSKARSRFSVSKLPNKPEELDVDFYAKVIRIRFTEASVARFQREIKRDFTRHSAFICREFQLRVNSHRIQLLFVPSHLAATFALVEGGNHFSHHQHVLTPRQTVRRRRLRWRRFSDRCTKTYLSNDVASPTRPCACGLFDSCISSPKRDEVVRRRRCQAAARNLQIGEFFVSRRDGCPSVSCWIADPQHVEGADSSDRRQHDFRATQGLGVAVACCFHH